MATCGTGAIDVGAPSTFLTNKPVYNSTGRFFVVRDAGGLFAVTARCTHEGAICAVSGSDYRCPRHGALFTFDGTIVSGPVVTPLQHYAMCTLPSGNVGVDTTKTVAKSVRLVA
jgi:nitrite reductase/ring-hydroxylating ferredoxin subunit